MVRSLKTYVPAAGGKGYPETGGNGRDEKGRARPAAMLGAQGSGAGHRAPGAAVKPRAEALAISSHGSSVSSGTAVDRGRRQPSRPFRAPAHTQALSAGTVGVYEIPAGGVVRRRTVGTTPGSYPAVVWPRPGTAAAKSAALAVAGRARLGRAASAPRCSRPPRGRQSGRGGRGALGLPRFP